MTPVEQLNQFIASENSRIRRTFPPVPEYNIDSRIALIELSRAIDYNFCYPMLAKKENVANIGLLYAVGGSRSLCTFLDESVDRSGVPLLCSDYESQGWADSCIQHSGRIANLEHILELERDEIVKIQYFKDNHYKVIFPDHIVDYESFDVADQQWIRQLGIRHDQPRQDILKENFPKLHQKMRQLVYPWNDHFIGYKTDPEIDKHYYDVGILWARSCEGQVELPGDEIIGGYPFYAYRAAVGLMCGRALKHLGFTSELLIKHPELDLHNLLTIYSTREELEEYFCFCLGIDIKTAKHLINSITLDRNYWTEYMKVPGAPLPPFIQISDNHLIMLL